MSRADEIVAALRAERMRQGVSQRRLGLGFFVAESAVGAWEKGHVKPGAGLVRRWHTALGLECPPDVDEVFRADPPCGTRARYMQHVRRGDRYCQPCRAANAAYRRQWDAARRARAA